VVGSKAGSRPGYHYSGALTAAGVTWTPVTLDRWLTRPTDVAAGTTMAFQGVPSAQSRTDIIAYLITLAPPVAGK
jgi:cytochrome c